MTQKPFTQISAIESQIGIDSAVDSGQSGVKYRMAGSLHLVDISLEFGKLCHHLFDKIGRGLSHRIDVDKYRAGYLTHTAVAHAAPVLKRPRDESIGRKCHYGVVPVLHLDGRQRHIDHDAVGDGRGHHYPVAHAEHIVLRQLQAGYESEYAVLEYKHQHGRKRAQPREKHRG